MSVHSAPGEQNLRYWLSNEDWYPSKFTQNFLTRTPEAEANDALEEISRDADLEQLTPWSLFTLAFAMAGFTMSFGPAGPSINDRKAGIRAALLLGERGDPRALVPLSRIWSKGGLLSSKYQEQIEQHLIALLSEIPTDKFAARPTLELGDLATRVWNARPIARDLTSGQTDLLLSLARYLQAGQSVHVKALQTLTASPAPGDNRRLIQDTTRALLQEMTAPS